MVKKSSPDWGVRILLQSGVITEDHAGTHKYGSVYRSNCEYLILDENNDAHFNQN